MIRKHGAEAFKQLITEKAVSLVEFKMTQAAEKYDLTTVTGKTSALAEVMPNLAKLHNAVEREEYLRVLGQELNLSWDTILGELRKYQQTQQKSQLSRDKNVKNRNNTHDVRQKTPEKPAVKLEGLQKAEYTLLRLVLENKKYLEYVEQNISLEVLRDPGIKQIVQLCAQEIKEKGECFPTNLYPLLSDENLSSILSRVLMLEIPLDNIQDTLVGCINVIRGAGTEDRKGQILRELAEAEKVGDWQLVAQLMAEYKQLFKS